MALDIIMAYTCHSPYLISMSVALTAHTVLLHELGTSVISDLSQKITE